MDKTGTVHYEVNGNIAILTTDYPPLNLLSAGVRQGFSSALAQACADEAVEIIVVTGAGRAFIAGADISEFGVPSAAPSLDELFELIEASAKPIVAALNGVALGGGMEVALCCDYRIASPRAAVGLPEVKLGLLPGGGGTQRLPRLIGPVPALELILSGELVGAQEAARLGIVDEIIEGPLVEGALAYARALLERRAPRRKLRDDDSRLAHARGKRELFVDSYQRALQRRPNLFALEMIVQSVKAAVDERDFDAGLAIERRCFQQCVQHPQHAALKHLFFAERSCGKIPGVDRGAAARPIARALVLARPETEALSAKLAKAHVEVHSVASAEAVSEAALAGVDLVLAPASAPGLAALADRLPSSALLGLVLDDDTPLHAVAIGPMNRVVGLTLAPSGRVLEIVRGEATDGDVLVTFMTLAKGMRTIALSSRLDPSAATVGARLSAAVRRQIDALVDAGVEGSRLRRCLEDVGLQVELDPGRGSAASGGAKLEDDELRVHCLRAWSDEAQRIIDAGLVSRPGDIDVLSVHGHGFPELLGGPLHWASSLEARGG